MVGVQKEVRAFQTKGNPKARTVIQNPQYMPKTIVPARVRNDTRNNARRPTMAGARVSHNPIRPVVLTAPRFNGNRASPQITTDKPSR